MTEVAKFTDDYIWQDLAEKYNKKKRQSILNLLECGQILTEAKQKLGWGNFVKWIKDSRVNEGERTAERLMQIYRSYRHLLEYGDKEVDTIVQVGLMKMIELSKLPDEYHKSVVVKNENGVEEHVDVIDEHKLVNLLEKSVPVGHEIKPIKNMTIPQIKKYIQDEFYPDSSQGKDVGEQKVVEINTSYITQTKNLLSDIFIKADEARKDLEGYNEVRSFEMTEDDKQLMRDQLKSVKGILEALIVKINETKI